MNCAPAPGAIAVTILLSPAPPEPARPMSAARLDLPRQGSVGQCAFEKKRILITQPDDNYLRISSSLLEITPRNIIVLPVLFEGELKAVIELATLKPPNRFLRPKSIALCLVRQ